MDRSLHLIDQVYFLYTKTNYQPIFEINVKLNHFSLCFIFLFILKVVIFQFYSVITVNYCYLFTNFLTRFEFFIKNIKLMTLKFITKYILF